MKRQTATPIERSIAIALLMQRGTCSFGPRPLAHMLGLSPRQAQRILARVRPLVASSDDELLGMLGDMENPGGER